MHLITEQHFIFNNFPLQLLQKIYLHQIFKHVVHRQTVIFEFSFHVSRGSSADYEKIVQWVKLALNFYWITQHGFMMNIPFESGAKSREFSRNGKLQRIGEIVYCKSMSLFKRKEAPRRGLLFSTRIVACIRTCKVFVEGWILMDQSFCMLCQNNLQDFVRWVTNSAFDSTFFWVV